MCIGQVPIKLEQIITIRIIRLGDNSSCHTFEHYICFHWDKLSPAPERIEEFDAEFQGAGTVQLLLQFELSSPNCKLRSKE
jgi:hypothetical protein